MNCTIPLINKKTMIDVIKVLNNGYKTPHSIAVGVLDKKVISFPYFLSAMAA